MYDYLVIRLRDGVVSTAAEVQWILLNANGEAANPRRDSLAEVGDCYSSLARKPVVVVLAPARELLLSTAVVPVGQYRYAKQAMPYLVEEKLADDIEDVHIAMGPVAKNQPVPVAVVRHFDVINWLDALYSVGLPTTWLVPEQLALPWQPGCIKVFLDPCGSLIRDGQWHGLGCDLSNTALAVKLMAQQKGEASLGQLGRIEIAYSDDAQMQQSATQLREQLQRQLDNDISMVAYKESVTELLARTQVAALGDSINLLQGGYGAKTAGLRGTLNIGKVAATFAACVGLHLALTLGAGIWFDLRSDSVRSDAKALYSEWFPDAQRVFNPKRQLQSKLVNNEGVGSENLLSYISAVALAWQGQADSLQLESLDYEGHSGNMTLQLEAPAADTMVALQQHLQGRGLQAELKSVSQRGDLVSGRLELGGMRQ